MMDALVVELGKLWGGQVSLGQEGYRKLDSQIHHLKIRELLFIT